MTSPDPAGTLRRCAAECLGTFALVFIGAGACIAHHGNPDAHVRRLFLKKAFDELPAKLKMTAEDVNALLSAMAEAGGNVSEAARQLGQPQRKTDRRIARIRRHLNNRGFSA